MEDIVQLAYSNVGELTAILQDFVDECKDGYLSAMDFLLLGEANSRSDPLVLYSGQCCHSLAM